MKEVKIEKLPEIVKGKHGSYHLAKRDDDVAIYSKDFPPENAKCFEVFVIKKTDAKKSAESFAKRFGRVYDMNSLPDIREKYPVDEDFGKTAWTYPNLKSAEQRFDVLTQEIERKRKEKVE
jgi:hypothetical protein